jgi:hypothetical protein
MSYVAAMVVEMQAPSEGTSCQLTLQDAGKLGVCDAKKMNTYHGKY